jgi:hypothetical protein
MDIFTKGKQAKEIEKEKAKNKIQNYKIKQMRGYTNPRH